MSLVELVGPPAVGKSTLVDAAVRRGARDARREILEPRHPLLRPLADLARRRPPGGRRITDRLLTPPTTARIEAALSATAADWADYLDLILAEPGRPTEPCAEDRVLAVMERSWFLEAVRLRALLERLPDSAELPLLDEGLTHPYKVHAAVGADPVAVARYAEHVPLPEVLVVLSAEPEVVVRRIRERHRTEPGRARWNALLRDGDGDVVEQEVERVAATVAAIATAAERRGCPVVRLDTTSEDPDRAVEELLVVSRRGSAP